MIFDSIAEVGKALLVELAKGSAAGHVDGATEVGTDLTGNIWFDISSEAVWFEVQDVESRTTCWASMDFPEYAAPGEYAVCAADEEDMRNFDANRQPQPTYRVVATDIEGLEPDEVLYSGLTREVALATADSASEMGERDKYNFLVQREK